jgi:hypothetical protein
MRKRLRRRVRMPSPAMVVALLALLVALGGSATAAVQLVTSADIENGTIRSIDVRNGSLTGFDVDNNSIRGADVRESTLAKVPNADRLDGLDSTRFFPGGNLPRGKTIRGSYVIVDTAAAVGNQDQTPISYGFRLASAPARHYIQLGTTPPAECPGSGSNPRARPGHLCLYETFNSNTSSRGVQAVSDPRSGAEVTATSAAAGIYFIFGSWAVTSP